MPEIGTLKQVTQGTVSIVSVNAGTLRPAQIGIAHVDYVIPDLKPILIRPDAELVKTWSCDRMLVEDDEVTIPAYSTSAKTVLASTALSNDTYTITYTEWNWYIVARFLTIPNYNVSIKGKGRVDYHFSSYLYEITDVESGTFYSMTDGSKAYSSRIVVVPSSGCIRQLYWSSDSAIAMYTATTYGIAQVATAPSLSSGKITINTPSVQMRGSSTYFTSTYWGAITDIRRQYVFELWKAPKNNLNIDGWSHTHNMQHIAECVNSNTHKLT